jgi:putative transcriptional regulator
MTKPTLGQKLIQGMQEALEHSRGKDIGARVHLPKHIDVQNIRDRLDLTQENFAIKYGFALTTLRNWEQGIREPTGPARILLMMLQEDPKGVEKLLYKAIKHSQDTSAH